ncbi:DUF1064 domain-containing protein [Phaeobacter italicus]|uniref:DUF1064 domain-containing protein n=1 Tax=Phaeobacter italicus TaxID=481446 RepID=UPI001ADB2CE8|nr:DUF1064 domain-containing protein [Phaeobacter italicus]MBO9441396.1 DUF1064 domain-containing protein [Phaeobacter italicus]
MNKFNAVAVTVDGIRFASLKEARRWGQLRLLEEGGEIRNLRRQVRIDLEGKNGPLRTRTGRQMRLTVDFAYEDKRLNWAEVYEDSKGAITRDYEVRRAVAQAMGIEVIET